MMNLSVILRPVLACCLLLGSVMTPLSAQVFRVGILKYKTREAVETTFLPLLSHVAEAQGKRLELTILEDESLAYRLQQGEFDLGIFKPFSYLEAKENFPELVVFATHMVKGETQYGGAILSRKDAGIQSLTDFSGKPFTFVKESSTSGFTYPRSIFREYGLDIDTLFSTYEFSGSHVRAVTSLLSGKTSGIAIDLHGLDTFSPEDRDQLQPLKSYQVPYPAYVFSPQLSPGQRALIRQSMLEAYKIPALQAAFDNPLGLERFVEATDESYNSLRRYLGMNRLKPSISLQLNLREAARKSLEAKGDVIPLVEESILNALRRTDRFSAIRMAGDEKADLPLELRISLIDGVYHYLLYLESEQMGEGDVDLEDLRLQLPEEIARQVLTHLPISTFLLFSGDRWFVNYGENDGIHPQTYDFILELGDDKEMALNESDIEEFSAFSTHFVAQPAFRDLLPLRIEYHNNPDARALASQLQEQSKQETGFWSKLDNIWGVIGLLVAFVSIAIGSFFTGRKKKRFRGMLLESNHLLREYIAGQTRIDNKVVLMQEKINESLERGYIDENQFLILKHRLEDIDGVIRNFMLRQDPLPGDVSQEIAQILESDVINERQFTRILSLVKKADKS